MRVSLTDFTRGRRRARAPLVQHAAGDRGARGVPRQLRRARRRATGWTARWIAGGHDRKWTIALSDRSEPVGFTALYGLGGQTAPELGILIGDPDVWGHGVGTEAQRLTIERAFGEFDAHRVVRS